MARTAKIFSARYTINLPCTFTTMVGTFERTSPESHSWPKPPPPTISGQGNETGYEADGAKWGYLYFASGSNSDPETGARITEGSTYESVFGKFLGKRRAKGVLDHNRDHHNFVSGQGFDCKTGIVRWKAHR